MPQTQLKADQLETVTFEQKVETAVQTGAASDDVVKKAGDTMTGTLNVPTVNLTSVNPADTATFFGTDDSGNSTLHMRIGNGTGDKIQIESWNGSAATSLMEVGQTTVTIKGDLVVSGTTTTVNSETLEVGDNYIILNSGVTGSPTLDAGIRVERGSEANVEFKWNETEDKWEADSGLIVSGNIRTAVGSGLSDADGDTYITVEETADDDTIHFYAGGSEVEVSDSNLTILNTGSSSGEIYLSANVNNSNQNSDSPRLNFTGRGQTAGFGIQAINVTGYGKKDLVFYAHNSSDYTTYYEAMRIKYDGNVGIGTTSPASRLHIVGGQKISTFSTSISGGIGIQLLQTGDQTSNSLPMILWDNLDDPNVSKRHWIRQEGNTLFFKQSDSGTFDNVITNLTIDSDGDVGIGIATPSDKLHVSGGITANGHIKAGAGHGLSDADGDTLITVEETADEDKIHLYVGGEERVVINGQYDVEINKDDEGQSHVSLALQKNYRSAGEKGDAYIDIQAGNGDVSLEHGKNGYIAVEWSSANEYAANMAFYVRGDINYKYPRNPDGSSVGTYAMSPKLFIRYDGRIGIGTTSPSQKLDVIGNVRADDFIEYSQPLPENEALPIIMAMKNKEDGTLDHSTFPDYKEEMIENEDGTKIIKKGISLSLQVKYLIKALQEQQEQISSLQQQIDSMK